MLVMTQKTTTFTDRDELVQEAVRIRWAVPEEAAAAVVVQADDVAGWRRAVADAGGRMATEQELDQAGL